MTVLAQAMPGVALAVGLALLCIRRVRTAAVLLAMQSAATAVAAAAVRQPLLALPPLLLGALVWFAPGRLAGQPPEMLPAGGTKPALAAGAILTVLCQSRGELALPLSVLLLAILLAACRRETWMRVMALVAIQNGIVLAACLSSFTPELFIVATAVLPLPLGLSLILARRPGLTARAFALVRLAPLDLAASLAGLAATVLLPLSPLATAFAPLLALDGLFQSYARGHKVGLAPGSRIAALVASTMVTGAACFPQPAAVWLAVLAAIGAHFAAAPNRRQDTAILAFAGAGVLLFGLLLAEQPTVLACFCVFAGMIAVAAAVPDLAVPLTILLLRLSSRTDWPETAATLGLGIALAALAVCAIELSRRRGVALLYLAQTSIAAAAICLGTPDGRFAAVVLLTLSILSRTATRLAGQPGAALSFAALAGVPPLGVFPGLVLAALALAGHNAWLLLPAGAAFVPILLAVRPVTPGLSPSLAWIPLGLALAAGYLAPDGLVRWWHLLAAGTV